MELNAVKNGLTTGQLKGIALAAMTVDHLALALLPAGATLTMSLRLIGRIAMPLFCFCVAEGYAHTRSFQNYAYRLFFTGILSQVPYSLFKYGEWIQFRDFNVCFTLLIGLLLMRAWDGAASPWAAVTALLTAVLAAYYCDWQHWGVLMCLGCHLFRGKGPHGYFTFSAAAVLAAIESAYAVFSRGMPPMRVLMAGAVNLGILLALPFAFLYNGRPGKGLPGGRAFFYIYYPLHMLAIYALSRIL